jgi:hypothetical protein
MADRLLTVNAYTTFDLLDGSVEGHGFEEEAFATLDVRTAREDPDDVSLAVELDNTALDAVPPHADRVRLTAAQARTLAAELRSAADRVDGGDG